LSSSTFFLVAIHKGWYMSCPRFNVIINKFSIIKISLKWIHVNN
jgi:hypothetical protein